MSPELDKQLCEKYPKIFRDRHAPMTQTCLFWGLEVGDGWYNIVDTACALIQWHIDQSRKNVASAIQFNRALRRAVDKDDLRGLEWYFTTGRSFIVDEWAKKRALEASVKQEWKTVVEPCQQVVASQIKEKFGTLRFYYDGGDDYVDGVVQMAEGMAHVTCEVCGATGKLNREGWIRCRCEEHKGG